MKHRRILCDLKRESMNNENFLEYAHYIFHPRANVEPMSFALRRRYCAALLSLAGAQVVGNLVYKYHFSCIQHSCGYLMLGYGLSFYANKYIRTSPDFISYNLCLKYPSPVRLIRFRNSSKESLKFANEVLRLTIIINLILIHATQKNRYALESLDH